MSYFVLGPCPSISPESAKIRLGEKFSSSLFRILRVGMGGVVLGPSK